jgi:predicted glycosyltransferase involved in capsule biosynthesis
MNNITIIQTYYNDEYFLKKAIEQWNSYTVPVSIILIDDASRKFPAFDVMKQSTFNTNVSLYVIDEDIGFNSHGCRNLGAAVAKTEWMIFLDIDHFVTVEDLEKLYNMDLNPDHWYSFCTRHNDFFMSSEKPSNTFMCNKTMYEKSGGYDESYTPFHYGDREFLHTMETNFPRTPLPDIEIQCIRGGRQTIVDTSISKPVYDNEKYIMYTPPFDKSKIQYHDKRLNFTWKKLI